MLSRRLLPLLLLYATACNLNPQGEDPAIGDDRPLEGTTLAGENAADGTTNPTSQGSATGAQGAGEALPIPTETPDADPAENGALPGNTPNGSADIAEPPSVDQGESPAEPEAQQQDPSQPAGNMEADTPPLEDERSDAGPDAGPPLDAPDGGNVDSGWLDGDTP